jgi:xylan 1,4-beta-xylosidase
MLGDLARVDANGNRVLYPGNYTVLLDEPTIVHLTFSLTGSETVLDKWPQPP